MAGLESVTDSNQRFHFMVLNEFLVGIGTLAIDFLMADIDGTLAINIFTVDTGITLVVGTKEEDIEDMVVGTEVDTINLK